MCITDSTIAAEQNAGILRDPAAAVAEAGVVVVGTNAPV